MPLELDPPQPDAVTAAVERLLAAGEPLRDPWWAAGIAEALRGDDGAAAQDAGGGAGVVEA
jgi:hypothetical protein